MSWREHGVAWLVLSTSLLIGCESPPQPSTEVLPVETNEAIAPDSSAWTAVSEDAQIVARVGGAPITRAMVLDVQKASPGLSARDALQRLIDLEVLAQHAAELGLHTSGRAQRARQESVVQRFLTGGFEPEVTPDSLPIEKAKQLFYMPNVRKLYDHADARRMAHVFFTCCDPKSESCDRPEILQCFAESGETIQIVYAELKTMTAGAEGNVDALVEAMEAYRTDNESRFLRHPFAFRTRAFYYDPDKPHEEQKGYDIIAEAVARTVIEGAPAVLQEPVQSPFGWHVIAQLDHDPEDRRTADDPTVIADIRENMLPMMRQARFKGLLGRLTQDLGVEIDPAPLEHLNVRFNTRL